MFLKRRRKNVIYEGLWCGNGGILAIIVSKAVPTWFVLASSLAKALLTNRPNIWFSPPGRRSGS